MSDAVYEAEMNRALTIGNLTDEEWDVLLEEKRRRFAAWCDAQGIVRKAVPKKYWWTDEDTERELAQGGE